MKLDETLLDDAIAEANAEIERLSQFVTALTEARRLVSKTEVVPAAAPAPTAAVTIPVVAPVAPSTPIPEKPATMVDGLVLALSASKKPMHAKELLEAVRAMGFAPPESSVVSTLSRDRRFRFKALGKNVYRMATPHEQEELRRKAPPRKDRRNGKGHPLPFGPTKA